MARPRVFSGIQPTADSFHLGNYLGALRQWVALQDTHDAVYCVVDMHAITVPQDPALLRRRTRTAAAQLLGAGLDPERCIVFVQSQVPEHAELTRDLAQRFNHRFGSTFVVPGPYILADVAKITDLVEPTAKMSKSSSSPQGIVDVLDEPAAIRRKISRAVTDTGSGIEVDETNKPGITNLLRIYSGLAGETVADLESRYAGVGYGQFKKDLAEVVVRALAPIRERTEKILA